MGGFRFCVLLAESHSDREIWVHGPEALEDRGGPSECGGPWIMNGWQVFLIAMSPEKAGKFNRHLTALETHGLHGLVRGSPHTFLGETDSAPGGRVKAGPIGRVLNLIPDERDQISAAAVSLPAVDADLQRQILNALTTQLGDPDQTVKSPELLSDFLAEHQGSLAITELIPPDPDPNGICPVCGHSETDHAYVCPDDYCDGWAHCWKDSTCWRSWPPVGWSVAP